MVQTIDTAQALDPYEMLQVSRDASLAEIRRAYKTQVLEAHPDKNPHRSEWSERRIRELLRAFEILGDRDRRREYDHRWRATRRTSRRQSTEQDLFFFRKNDAECRALRVLYFLVHMRGEEAASLVDGSEARYGAKFLGEQLAREDYLDCLFLLGEHFIKTRRYSDALERFLSLYHVEQRARFRRHYFGLTMDHLKSLYIRYLPRTLPPEDLIDVVQSGMVVIPWNRKETARLYLALAKAHEKLDQRKLARENLAKALGADPGFTKAKRWSAELALR